MTSSTLTAASAIIDFVDLGRIVSGAGHPRLPQGEGHRPHGHAGAHRFRRGRLHQGGGGPLRQRPRRGGHDAQGKGWRGRHRPSHPARHVDGRQTSRVGPRRIANTVPAHANDHDDHAQALLRMGPAWRPTTPSSWTCSWWHASTTSTRRASCTRPSVWARSSHAGRSRPTRA